MRLADRIARRPRLLVAALAAALAFSFLGARGLYETTEGRYALSALEMVQDGGYLEPTLSHRPHWTKPPMTYWAIAGGIAVAGPTDAGARLAGALAFWLTVLAVMGIGAALWDATAGVVAGLVYLSSPFPVAAATVVSTDTLLAFWEVAAMYLFVRARGEPRPDRARWWIRAMWLAWGLAFLTKGPPGLLPLAAVVAVSRLAPRPARLADPLGVLLFVASASWWYAVVALRHPGLLAYFLGDEVIGRVARNEFGRNPQWYKPLVVYLPFLVLGQGAWLAAGARAIRAERLHVPRSLWERLRRGGPASLLLLWLALPLAVLSISSSRLPLYVLPLYAPIAVAIGRSIVRGAPGAALRRAAAVAIAQAAVLLLVKAVSGVAAPASPKDMRRLHAAVTQAAGPGAEVLAFGDDRLYGLQFYLGGALRRVSVDGREPWADLRLEDALSEVAGAHRAYALVVPSRAAAALEGSLGAAGVPFRRVRAEGAEVLVVERGAAAVPARAPGR